MHHVLIPTDGSDTAFNAARFAITLFGTDHTRYTLVHAYLKPAYRNALLPRMDTGREAANKLRRFERRCRKHADGVMLARRTSPSPLADVLNGLVAKGRGELIVMGTQGEGNYGLVGRNTTAVVLGSQVPVIAVPAQWRPTPVKRILLASDGGPLSKASLVPLIDIARRTGAEVVVAHVRDNAVTFDERSDRRVLGALLAGIRHSFVTVIGSDVTRTLDELAQQGRVQLVALVHRRRNFWQRLFTSSKARRMALHTTTPVLVLPERP